VRQILSLRPRELSSAAVLVAAFAILAALTTQPLVTAWDVRVVQAVNGLVATGTVLGGGAAAVSDAGSPAAVDVLTVVVVMAVWVRGGHTGRVRAVLYLVAARVVELGIETTVKYLMNRRRPSVQHALAIVHDPSFPSGHTAGTAVLCVSVLVLAWPRLSRLGHVGWATAAAVAVIAVGASRVVLGVHYVTDVLGGALLGVATALAMALTLAPPVGAPGGTGGSAGAR
jgi:undecaprenyl-diphosphatase